MTEIVLLSDIDTNDSQDEDFYICCLEPTHGANLLEPCPVCETPYYSYELVSDMMQYKQYSKHILEKYKLPPQLDHIEWFCNFITLNAYMVAPHSIEIIYDTVQHRFEGKKAKELLKSLVAEAELLRLKGKPVNTLTDTSKKLQAILKKQRYPFEDCIDACLDFMSYMLIAMFGSSNLFSFDEEGYSTSTFLAALSSVTYSCDYCQHFESPSCANVFKALRIMLKRKAVSNNTNYCLLLPCSDHEEASAFAY